MPGHFAGKVENSFCRRISFAPWKILGNHDAQGTRSKRGVNPQIRVNLNTPIVLLPTEASQLDNSTAYPNRDRLRAITCPQLLHDVPDVDLDGLFRNEELFGNVPIPISASDVPKDLSLSLS